MAEEQESKWKHIFPRLRIGTLLPSLHSIDQSKSHDQTHSQRMEILSALFVEEKTAKSCGKKHEDKKGGRTGATNVTYHQNNCILFKTAL